MWDEGDQDYGFDSNWVLMTSNPTFLAHPAIVSRVQDGWTHPFVETPWSDDYSNLLEALRSR